MFAGLGDRCARLLTEMCMCAILAGVASSSVTSARANTEEDNVIAQRLAAMLQAGRAVVSEKQDHINNPDIGDKGLNGKAVLAETLRLYREAAGGEPPALEPTSRQDRLLRAQMDAIVEVIDAHQQQLNQRGIAFKGFIPATFARLVNEAFGRRAGTEAEVKVTAPPDLIRNLKARPDKWEAEVMRTSLQSTSWPKGQFYSAVAENRGRLAYRVAIPEYYASSCLSCHGTPKGQIDPTGYPKEGGREGDLGAVISITLYR